jgi:lysophospholipase L1-like esterase
VSYFFLGSITEFAAQSVLNAGISGARIRDAAGLMADLSPILRTNTIILVIGINDAITTQKRSDTIRADFERLVRLAKDTGAEVFAATVGPVDFTKPDGAARDSGLINAINTVDGVHLTEVGAQRWRSAVEAVVCPSWGSPRDSGPTEIGGAG